MVFLYGRAGALDTQKRRFPARAVLAAMRDLAAVRLQTAARGALARRELQRRRARRLQEPEFPGRSARWAG
jgi:hypothetical protein